MPITMSQSSSLPNGGEEVFELFLDVFVGLLSLIGALLAFVLFLVLLMPLVRWSFQQARRHGRTVRIELYQATEATNASNEIFRGALHIAFAHFRRSVAILQSRLALRDRGLSYFTDCAHLLPPAERIDIQVEVGPIRFGNLAHILSWYTGAKEFVLRISVMQDSAPNYSVFASLSLNQRLWHSWRDQVAPDQVDSFCQRLVREVVWVTSHRGPSEVQLIGHWRQSELHLLEGLERLSTYLTMPADVSTLEGAVDLFEKARRQPWAYQADLLAAIAVSLAQREPRKAAQRMQQLVDEYGHVRRRRAVLLYNSAVANFRLYDVDDDSQHYDDAIKLFESIKQPGWRWYWWLPIRKQAKVHDWTLYLLAQVGIANCLAHKLNVVSDSEKEPVINRVRAINGRVAPLVNRLRRLLGPAADEVEWRIFNAEAVTELFGPRDANRGIEAAQRGLRIDPHNLPLKANLGSLILLQAQQSEERNDTEARTRALKEGEQIFVRLRQTGWDSGFIAYRLGRISRLQGEFSKAIEFLELGKNKDVANRKIEAEIVKARARNSQFDC